MQKNQLRNGAPAIGAHPSLLAGIHSLGFKVLEFLRELSSICWFFASTVDQVLYDLRRAKIPFRRLNFFEQTKRAGVDAVPLVFLISLFLGLTMALLTGYQLQRYGTERLVPGLLTISFVRELGPLLTGFVLAARSGAAFTAELSTMTVSDEVDAIETMGIGAFRYLVVPRVLAIFLLFPCLSIISNLSGLLGAAFISNLELKIPFLTFANLAVDQLLIKDMIVGVIKSFFFGGIIGFIACYKGLTVKGGAAGVGLATTSSVVISIGTVIAMDMICNIIVTKVLP